MTMNLTFLQGLLTSISQRMRSLGGESADSEAGSVSGLIAACDALIGSGGDASQLVAARQALSYYAQLGAEDRLAFFNALAERYSASADAIHAAYAAYTASESNEALQTLFSACEPRRQELLRRLNRHPGATYELVRMRAHLIGLLKEHPSLRPVDADFRHLFASWFNRGFLVLEHIDWNTPAAILEKVIRYEAVHEIQDWDELRKRLNPRDRLCYAFFHPAIGDEPLIFVEVALCQGIPGNIDSILADRTPIDPAVADTAVFYSISNCQAGLAGISFGNFLIKQVAQDLFQEFPNLRQFVTLSPLPGFSSWLHEERSSGRLEVVEDEVERLLAATWVHDHEERAALAPTVSRLGACYLVAAKDHHGRPRDPVARFHLGNGASLHQVNWPADLSAKGQAQSFGLMVNYLYQLDRVELNHEAFSRDGTVVCSPEVRQLTALKKRSWRSNDPGSRVTTSQEDL